MKIRMALLVGMLVAATVPALAQDECVDALPVSTASLQQFTLDTTGATSSGPWTTASHSYPDVWWDLEFDISFGLLAFIRVDGDATIEVHEGGCDGPVITSIDGANANHGTLTLLTFQRLWPHTNYAVRVALRQPGGGTAAVTIDRGYFNDVCSRALELRPGREYQTVGGTATALTNQPWPCEPAEGARRDIWYRFTPVTTGPHALLLSDQSIDTDPDALVEVIQGSCGSTQSVACLNLSAAGSVADLNFDAVAGTNYLVRLATHKYGEIQLVERPAHATCETAEVVVAGTYEYNTFGAAVSPATGCASATRSRWYRFIAPADGILLIRDSENSTNAFTGDCGSLDCHSTFATSVRASAGQTVYLQVMGQSLPPAPPAAEGTLTLEFLEDSEYWELVTDDGPTVGWAQIQSVGDLVIGVKHESARYRIVAFDTVNRQWLVRDPVIQTPSPAPIAFDGKYVVGGGFAAGNRLAVETIDTSTWTSTISHTQTVNRAGVCGAATEDRLIFAGGTSGGVFRDAVDIYIKELDTWIVERLPEPKANMVAEVVGRTAFFVGGQLSSPTFIQALDLDTLQWTTRAGPPGLTGNTFVKLGHHGATLIMMNGSESRLALYDTVQEVWSYVDFPSERILNSLVVVGDELLISGQLPVNYGPYPSTVLVYSFATESWREDAVWLDGPVLATSTREGAFHFAYVSAYGQSARVGQRYVPIAAEYLCSPAVPNASGRAALIHAVGDRSAALGELRLTATGMPAGSLGYFIVGTQTGLTQPTISAGPICVGGLIGRYTAPSQIFQGPVGRLDVDLDSIPTTPTTVVVPGDTLTFQAWYRDPVQTSNLTDAISITFE